MSQATQFGLPLTGPMTGSQVAARANATTDALLSSNSGTAAPAYRVRGTLWEDTTAGVLKKWDGTAWVSVLEPATQAETDAGVSDTRGVTPKKLRAGFSISLGPVGYIAFPSWMGGHILQWGSSVVALNGTGDGSVILPIVYPTSHYTAVACNGDALTFGDRIFVLGTLVPSGINISVRPSPGAVSVRVNWLSVGK